MTTKLKPISKELQTKKNFNNSKSPSKGKQNNQQNSKSKNKSLSPINKNNTNSNNNNNNMHKSSDRSLEFDPNNLKQMSVYKNVNNYRHIFENHQARDENVFWLMKLREIPLNLRAKGNKDGLEVKQRTIPIAPTFHYQHRDDKQKYDKNPYKEFHTKGNLGRMSNELKSYRGIPPNQSHALFETLLRSPSKLSNNRNKRAHSLDKEIENNDEFNNSTNEARRFKVFQSHNIPVINKFNSRDSNHFFNVKEKFNSDIYNTNYITNNSIPLNNQQQYNSEYNEKLFYNKNNINKYSSINDYPIFLPPKQLSSMNQVAKLNKIVTRPFKYSLTKIDYNGQKIVKKEITEQPETSFLIGSHQSGAKYNSYYKERNVNSIRHILSDNNLVCSQFNSGYRCSTETNIQDNRQFITGISDRTKAIFGKDFLYKNKMLGSLNRDNIRQSIKDMQSELRIKSRSKDPFSNKDFSKS